MTPIRELSFSRQTQRLRSGSIDMRNHAKLWLFGPDQGNHESVQGCNLFALGVLLRFYVLYPIPSKGGSIDYVLVQLPVSVIG